MRKRKECEFQYDYSHPAVKAGEVESGSFCQEMAFKGKNYCEDHCYEMGILSKEDASRVQKRKAREKVEPAPAEPDPFMDRMMSLFGVLNFNAASAYSAMKSMRIVPPGEDALEMYVYASWLTADPETRYPQLEEDLAAILGVSARVFEKWAEIPEVFEARNKVLTKLALMIGTPRYLMELIRGLGSKDSSLRSRAFDVFGKKFLKVDDGDEEKKDNPFNIPDEMVPLLQNILKNLDAHVGRREDSAVKAVRLSAAVSEIVGEEDGQ